MLPSQHDGQCAFYATLATGEVFANPYEKDSEDWLLWNQGWEDGREAELNRLQKELDKVNHLEESDYLPIQEEMDRIIALVLTDKNES